MSKQKTAQQIAEETILFKSKKYYTIEQMADTIEANSNALNKILNLPRLSIPKKIAELADKEFNQGDDVLRFGFSTTEFGFANEELRFWVTNYGEYDEVATERANILSAYLAGKALGVELVEVK